MSHRKIYLMSTFERFTLIRIFYCHFENEVNFLFLANDVTLVTSYGYCQRLKINDRRLDRCCTYVRETYVCLTICEAGGIFCETMGGGVHRDTESLTVSAAQTHTANVMGVRPPGFEVFCIRKCGSTSNACFVYVRSGRILFAL